MPKTDDRWVVDTSKLEPSIYFGPAAVGATIQIEDHFFKIVSVKNLPHHQQLTLVPARTISSNNFKIAK